MTDREDRGRVGAGIAKVLYLRPRRREPHSWTVEQVADFLAVSTSFVYRLVAEGRLRHTNIGSPTNPRYSIAKADLDAFLDACQRGPE